MRAAFRRASPRHARRTDKQRAAEPATGPHSHMREVSLRLWKRLRKPERILRGPVLPVLVQAIFRLGNCWDVSLWNPPKCVRRPYGLLEPLGASFEEFEMMRLVDVASKRLHRLPDGHVYQFERIFGIDDIRCVARIGLQPPDKAGSGFRRS